MDPITTLMIGDSHGNYLFIEKSLKLAVQIGAKYAFQLGDFGFWPKFRRDESNVKRPFPDPDSGFASKVNDLAKELGLPVIVLRGNHDWIPEANLYLDEAYDQPGLHFAPDGLRMSLNGHSILFTGGAVSVDQRVRTPEVSWWADEILTDAQADASIAGGHVDVWLTHDSVEIPPGVRPLFFGDKIQHQLMIQKQKMRRVFDAVTPSLHIHGHWHNRYSAPTEYGSVMGISCESPEALLVVEFGDQITVG